MTWRTAAGLGLSALMLSAAACAKAKGKTQVKAKAAKSAIPDSADQIIFGFRTFLTDQGVSKGVLLADTALSYDEATRMELRRVNVTFYTSVGL
ncbi:MAG: hypothetical protein RJA21_146, partial [Gemmatimonadota bacterium]